ncbi:MAG: glycosyltransferase, partial [Caldilineaceae bacterium]|nr:glycosyltransferase [Caldilineaceae bacterium]
VQTETFTPKAATDSLQKRLIFVGRLSALKNLPALLAATKLTDAQLTLIGEGPERAALVAQAEREGIAVTFLGTVPNQEIAAHLQQADLFVLPSKWEGHPKVLIEAMACGMPVVGTDVAGIRDVIIHGQTGLLCGLSGTEIAAAIEQLFADPALRRKLGQNARRFVEEHYAVPPVLALEVAALQEAVARNQGHGRSSVHSGAAR